MICTERCGRAPRPIPDFVAERRKPRALGTQIGNGPVSGKSLPVIRLNAGLHTLRPTFLTEAGEYRDTFKLQYIAGHDTIKTTMRYVHPWAESVSRAFGRINQNQKEKPAESA